MSAELKLRGGSRPYPESEPAILHDMQPRCAGQVHLMFSPHPGHIDEAKALCQSCPLRRRCLNRAVDRGEQFGIWGGLTATERAALAEVADDRAAA